jgi:hypothetical protein
MEGEVMITVNGQQALLNFENNRKGADNTSTISHGSKNVFIVMSEGVTYMGDGTNWIRLSTPEEDNGFLNTSELINFEGVFDDGFEYLGVNDCGNAKCQAFKFTEGDSVSTVLFDGSSHLIRKAETQKPEISFDFSFSYGSARLADAPGNAKQFEGLEGLGAILEIYLPLLEDAGINIGELVPD